MLEELNNLGGGRAGVAGCTRVVIKATHYLLDAHPSLLPMTQAVSAPHAPHHNSICLRAEFGTRN